MNNDYSDRFCVVIQQTVSEMECYETVMGCLDTNIHKKSIMTSEQIREICKKCPHSNVD